jgi:hypothetical protein
MARTTKTTKAAPAKATKGRRITKVAKPNGGAATSTPRAESKQAQFIEALRTPKGISIAEAAERFGWQKHTVRGAIAGAIKKKLKLNVVAKKDEKGGAARLE